MKTIKVAEATEIQLNWLVAKCEKYRLDLVPDNSYSPSTNWAQGGPIIESNEIGIQRNAPRSAGREWEAQPSIKAKGAGGKWGYGATPLVAAMRCYSASKLGYTADIPEELL